MCSGLVSLWAALVGVVWTGRVWTDMTSRSCWTMPGLCCFAEVVPVAAVVQWVVVVWAWFAGLGSVPTLSESCRMLGLVRVWQVG